MGVPKYKPSKSRKRLRRSHDALTPAQMVACGNCGTPGARHRICGRCGHYPSRGEGRTRAVLIRNEPEGA